jgi:hypothetical protein
MLTNNRVRAVAVFSIVLAALLYWSPSNKPLPMQSAPSQAATDIAKVAKCCADPVQATAAAAEPVAAEQVEDPIFAEFDSWAAQYDETLPAAEVKRGVVLAEKRAVVLEKLISSDPQTALKHAVPVLVRNRLPAAVTTHLEERIQGDGEYAVAIATPSPASAPWSLAP